MWTSAGRKDIPGRGKGKFKGPEVGTCLACWRNKAVQSGQLEGVGVGEEEWEDAGLCAPWAGLRFHSERKRVIRVL